MEVAEVEVGQSLCFTSRIDDQKGPIIRVTEVSGLTVTGVVLEAKESPYTVGLPFHGLIRFFEKEE